MLLGTMLALTLSLFCILLMPRLMQARGDVSIGRSFQPRSTIVLSQYGITDKVRF